MAAIVRPSAPPFLVDFTAGSGPAVVGSGPRVVGNETAAGQDDGDRDRDFDESSRAGSSLSSGPRTPTTPAGPPGASPLRIADFDRDETNALHNTHRPYDSLNLCEPWKLKSEGGMAPPPNKMWTSQWHQAKRTVVERVRQYLASGRKRKDFVSTDCARCRLMYKEVKTFKRVVDSFETVVHSLRYANDAFFQELATTLESNLPVPFEFSRETNNASRVTPSQHTVAGGSGSGVHMRLLGRQVYLSLEDSVLRPIGQWKACFASAKRRMVELEARRLTLDFHRRAAETLLAEYNKLRIKPVDSRGARKERLEARMRSMRERWHVRDAKHRASLVSYASCEASAYAELRYLTCTAADLRASLCSAIAVQGSGFSLARTIMTHRVQDRRQLPPHSPYKMTTVHSS